MASLVATRIGASVGFSLAFRTALGRAGRRRSQRRPDGTSKWSHIRVTWQLSRELCLRQAKVLIGKR